MGLDMYLYGCEGPVPEPGVDDYGISKELGYWRKHPGLHGYIVQNFAGGVDECQRIPLTPGNLYQIREAVLSKALPETTGFFFGPMRSPNDQDTLAQIRVAITYLEDKPGRSVYYRASW